MIKYQSEDGQYFLLIFTKLKKLLLDMAQIIQILLFFTNLSYIVYFSSHIPKVLQGNIF